MSFSKKRNIEIVREDAEGLHPWTDGNTIVNKERKKYAIKLGLIDTTTNKLLFLFINSIHS